MYLCIIVELMNKDKIQYWVDLSEYDIETAFAMLKSKRFLYVGFMCHQTIEKILKGYYVFKFNEIPPFTHNLGFLTAKSGLENLLNEDQQAIIDELEPLNIEARYPEYKDRLMLQLTPVKCKELIKKTTTLHLWIKEKLSKK